MASSAAASASAAPTTESPPPMSRATLFNPTFLAARLNDLPRERWPRPCTKYRLLRALLRHLGHGSWGIPDPESGQFWKRFVALCGEGVELDEGVPPDPVCLPPRFLAAADPDAVPSPPCDVCLDLGPDGKDAALRRLRQDGLLHLPGALTAAQAGHILTSLRTKGNLFKQSGRRALTDSAGNGRHGEYAYVRPPWGTTLHGLRDALGELLGLDGVGETRFVVLRYGEGGENYLHQQVFATLLSQFANLAQQLGFALSCVYPLHQDQQVHPYQALVLLSEPGARFTGGQLFVQDAADVRRPPVQVEWRGAGDVVVFAANRKGGAEGTDLYHGMRPVQAGTGPTCERWAIGLLQSAASSNPNSAIAKRKRKQEKRQDEKRARQKEGEGGKEGTTPSNKSDC